MEWKDINDNDEFTAYAKNWSVDTPIDGGRLLAPQDQTQTPATPSTITVLVGRELSVSVEEATDSDKWTQDINGDGDTSDEGESATASESVSYSWSGGGNFEDAGANSTTWKATSPGVYTLVCTIDDAWTQGQTGVSSTETGNRNDAPITRSIAVTVYQVSLTVARSGTEDYGETAKVAAGGKGGEHTATLLVQVEPVIAGLALPQPTITDGGRGKTNDPDDITATATLSVAPGETEPKTDSEGKIRGSFTSGNRAETTIVKLILDDSPGASNNPPVNPSVDIEQSWTELEPYDKDNPENAAWTHAPFFYFGVPSPIEYKMAFEGDNGKVPISGHTVDLKTSVLSGMVWEAEADTDGDGEPDGQWKPVSYNKQQIEEKGLQGVATYSYPTPRETPAATYHASLEINIYRDEVKKFYFIPDYVGFRSADNDVFEEPIGQ